MEWLEELETRVHEATEHLRELREENQGLQQQVQELATKLAAGTADPGEENEALRKQIADLELKLARAEETAGHEREEIRGRVQRLTRHLEELAG
jgi:uncharacterized coiled-coil DUF342 family protein